MPNIHRFLLKTLCVFGVTFTLTLPYNNAWGITQCECKTKGQPCTFQSSEEEDWAAWTWVQTCKNSGAYCLRQHQTWAANKNYITCPGNTVFVDGEDCGCSKPWEGLSEEEEEEGKEDIYAECNFAHLCPGEPTYSLPSINGTIPTGYIAEAICSKSAGSIADIVVFYCDTSKGYYMSGTEITHPTPKPGTGDPACTYNGGSSLSITLGYGNTEEWSGCSYCDETKPDWIGCDSSGIDCFGGNPGSYDPSLYERQVGYVFDPNGNYGDGSCTKQILHNGAWRCKAGFYPDRKTLNTVDGVDTKVQPYFDCIPCPLGWKGTTYTEGTPNILDSANGYIEYLKNRYEYTFNGEPYVKEAINDFNTCVKCPAGYSTFLSSYDAPLQYYEGAVNCTPCPGGYFNNGTQNIDVTVHKIYGVAITPVTKKGNGCELCPQNTYSNKTSGATACDNCPDAFITDEPIKTDRTTHNDSIKKCYIDTNVKLSDSLGKITLSEEIGSGTKLYHQ